MTSLGLIGRYALGFTLVFATPAPGRPAAATPTVDRAWFEKLRAVDLRMATIAYRLATANAALCRDLAPTPGIALHAADQYAADDAATRAVFAFVAPVAIEAVVPGSPAARAGVLADDALVAVDGAPVAVPAATRRPTSATRDAALAQIAVRPAAAPLVLTVERAGERRRLTVAASPGCRSAFEVLLGRAMDAHSDGRVVQLGVRFFERYPDDQIAAIVAHELSHTILRHRARLEAAGVKWGLFAEFGRNGRLFRRTEDDADRLSVHLLSNAGYDPYAAVTFWREHGDEVDGVIRSRTHGSARARADAIAREIALLPATGESDDSPTVLATRDEPLR